MILVDTIRLDPASRRAIGVSWELADFFDNVLDYRFIVMRSNAPEGDYVDISPPLTDTYAFIDVGADVSGRGREWYYRVRVYHVPSDTSVTYGSADARAVRDDGLPPGGVSFEAEADLVALEARSRVQLWLEQFAGRRCLWFPRRTWGARCSCIDPEMMKPVIDDCRSCYGSGFAGGFHRPVELWLNIGAAAEQDMLHWIGKITASRRLSVGNGFYRLKTRDMIVEVEGRRYSVDSVQPTEKLRARVRSVQVLQEMPKANVEYEVPVSWDKNSLTAGPNKAFLPAMDVESYTTEANRRGL